MSETDTSPVEIVNGIDGTVIRNPTTADIIAARDEGWEIRGSVTVVADGPDGRPQALVVPASEYRGQPIVRPGGSTEATLAQNARERRMEEALDGPLGMVASAAGGLADATKRLYVLSMMSIALLPL
jgi:hypothetical protein